MLIINGIELEADFLDIEVLERYELALDKIHNSTRDAEGKRLSEVLRQQCQEVFDFFDAVFGEGAAEDVFQNKMNFLECFQAFETVVEHVRLKLEETGEITGKYKPERIQRRSKAKKK